MINLTDIKIGDTIKGIIYGDKIEGIVTGIGINKNRICFDLNCDRFLYAHQVKQIIKK